MKMKTFKNIVLATITLVSVISCEKPLEETIYSQLAPNTLFTSQEGISKVLNSAYASAHRNSAVVSWSDTFLGDYTAGVFWGKGGSIESLWTKLSEFTWDANHAQINSIWPMMYRGIRDANIVLDNINNENFSSSFITTTTAEAKFIRGWCYSELYRLYGSFPIYTSTTDEPVKARATDAESMAQIEADLTDAISNLPATSDFGRATKGAAMAVLTKHYLNTKQWQKAADMSNSVINTGLYSLQDSFAKVFAVDNEGNSEMVWALPKVGSSGDAINAIQALTFPKTFPLPYSNNGVFAARTYILDSFVDSFESGDDRLNSIVTEWNNASGAPQAAYGSNLSMPYKFPFDPNSIGWQGGTDVPVVRYADILLSRAEALNEVSGPSQEVIDLINQVRSRAKVSDLSLSGFTKETLRSAILQERKFEFWHEGKAREDLLRHDLFISDAVSRGKNADAHHKLFPIPQTEIDANELLEQNPGY